MAARWPLHWGALRGRQGCPLACQAPFCPAHLGPDRILNQMSRLAGRMAVGQEVDYPPPPSTRRLDGVT